MGLYQGNIPLSSGGEAHSGNVNEKINLHDISTEAHSDIRSELSNITIIAEAAQTSANNKATMAEVNSAISTAISGIPVPDVSGQISAHNNNETSHSDIRSEIANHTHTAADVGAAPTNHYHDERYYSLQGGTAIPANANLNDYKTVGNYYCASSNTAYTVTNRPNSISAFILKVEYAQGTSANYLIQTVKDLQGTSYVRYYLEGTWGSWGAVYSANNKPTPTDIGAAPTSHNHSASNITSGTLPVACGGTGVTSLSALATAIGSAKIATGTYTGTGSYGSEFTITVGFEPKLAIIYLSPSYVSYNGGNTSIHPVLHINDNVTTPDMTWGKYFAILIPTGAKTSLRDEFGYGLNVEFGSTYVKVKPYATAYNQGSTQYNYVVFG